MLCRTVYTVELECVLNGMPGQRFACPSAFHVVLNKCSACCTGGVRDRLLVHALADILCQAATDSAVVVCDIVDKTLSSSLPDDAHRASRSPAVTDELAVDPWSDIHDEMSSSSNSQTAAKRCRLGHEQLHNSLR